MKLCTIIIIISLILTSCGIPSRFVTDNKNPPSNTRVIPAEAWIESRIYTKAKNNPDPDNKINKDCLYHSVYVVKFIEQKLTNFEKFLGIGSSEGLPSETEVHNTYRFWQTGQYVIVRRMKDVGGPHQVPMTIEEIDPNDLSWGTCGYYFIDGDTIYLESFTTNKERRQYARERGTINKDGSILINAFQWVENKKINEENYSISKFPETLTLLKEKKPDAFKPDW
jgi:hypothetical protein